MSTVHQYDSEDLNILDDMIQDYIKIPLIQKHNKWQVTLSETHGIDYQVIIRNIPQNTLVIKSDEFPALTHFFQNRKGECKRSDFILVTDEAPKKFVVFIEMKAGNHSEAGIIQQLKGSESLFSYCQKIGQLFWGSTSFLEGYQYRFISFKEIRVNKQPTHAKKLASIHDSPEKMLKLSGKQAFFNFNQLVGNLELTEQYSRKRK